jgi:hypothetical protein
MHLHVYYYHISLCLLLLKEEAPVPSRPSPPSTGTRVHYVRTPYIIVLLYHLHNEYYVADKLLRRVLSTCIIVCHIIYYCRQYDSKSTNVMKW